MWSADGGTFGGWTVDHLWRVTCLLLCTGLVIAEDQGWCDNTTFTASHGSLVTPMYPDKLSVPHCECILTSNETALLRLHPLLHTEPNTTDSCNTSILISQSAELLMRVCSSPAEDISSSMLVTGDHPLTITLDNRHEKPIYVQARLQFSVSDGELDVVCSGDGGGAMWMAGQVGWWERARQNPATVTGAMVAVVIIVLLIIGVFLAAFLKVQHDKHRLQKKRKNRESKKAAEADNLGFDKTPDHSIYSISARDFNLDTSLDGSHCSTSSYKSVKFSEEAPPVSLYPGGRKPHKPFDRRESMYSLDSGSSMGGIPDISGHIPLAAPYLRRYSVDRLHQSTDKLHRVPEEVSHKPVYQPEGVITPTSNHTVPYTETYAKPAEQLAMEPTLQTTPQSVLAHPQVSPVNAAEPQVKPHTKRPSSAKQKKPGKRSSSRPDKAAPYPSSNHHVPHNTHVNPDPAPFPAPLQNKPSPSPMHTPIQYNPSPVPTQAPPPYNPSPALTDRHSAASPSSFASCISGIPWDPSRAGSITSENEEFFTPAQSQASGSPPDSPTLNRRQLNSSMSPFRTPGRLLPHHTPTETEL